MKDTENKWFFGGSTAVADKQRREERDPEVFGFAIPGVPDFQAE
jgi:hypothetical protein